MDGQRTVHNCYAILIGINAYRKKPLRGSVQDVQNIKAYLEGAGGFINIRMFTATGDNEPGSTSSGEDPKLWPTDDNIRSAFEEVIQSAKAGDSVYVHYSGHGTRERPNERSYNKSTGDLALVVLSGEAQKPEKYLWGRSLAYSLNAMVKKGLVVTLVLDCCFSASVYRSNPNVRFLPYDTEMGSVAQSQADWKSHDCPFENSTSRDVSMLPNWLINPEKYAILVACGPHEEAGEIEFPNGKVLGTLSYFLMKVLREDGGIGNSVNHIYERLRAEFRMAGVRESPVLYGNKDQSFLGQAILRNPTKGVIVSKKPDGRLELQVGLAQGVGVGDQFGLYPSGISRFVGQGDYMIARVVRVRAFTSDLEQLNTHYTPEWGRWVAKALSQRSLRKYAVRLAAQLSQLDELQLALDKRSLDSHSDSERHPFSFEVTLNSNEGYEINDGSGPANPSMPVFLSSRASVDEIGNTLEHLARFKLVKDLVNATLAAPFQNAFEIYINYQGNYFGPGCLIEVNDGKTVEMVMINRGASELFLATYDLGPSWQVENIEKATFMVMAAREDDGYIRREIRKLKMRVPDNMRERYGSCSDIVKVFVTSRPTSFDFLELPRLGEPARMDNADRTDGKDYPEGDWAGLSFHIRTVVPVSSSAETSTRTE